MKFILIFKTPDVLDQLKEQCENEEELEEATRCANLFITYGEYIGIHFDTEKDTARAGASE